MARPASPHPTDRELRLLQILWEHGPATVREIVKRLGGRSGYTSVLKILQIMTDKGLVRRDESQRSHVYHAAQPEGEVQEDIVGDVLERVFRGSAMQLVSRALSIKPASKGDLKEIRALLDRLEGTDA